MSAVAEPLPHTMPDDNLARRNAMVLAVAQALAGGNNTVIVSTASIVGAVLSRDANCTGDSHRSVSSIAHSTSARLAHTSSN